MTTKIIATPVGLGIGTETISLASLVAIIGPRDVLPYLRSSKEHMEDWRKLGAALCRLIPGFYEEELQILEHAAYGKPHQGRTVVADWLHSVDVTPYLIRIYNEIPDSKRLNAKVIITAAMK